MIMTFYLIVKTFISVSDFYLIILTLLFHNYDFLSNSYYFLSGSYDFLSHNYGFCLSFDF